MAAAVKYPRPSKSTRTRMRKIVFERDEWTCQDCGRQLLPMTADERSGRAAPVVVISGRIIFLELDHVTPNSAGGLFVEGNLRALCSPCNQAKSASTRYADWDARIARAQSILASQQPSRATAEHAIAALRGD